MSRTKRFDESKIEKKRGDFVWFGEAVKLDSSETPKWKRTKDKKRHNKSSSWFKKQKQAERRARRNQEVKNLNAGNLDIDDVPLPKEPRSNDWEWN